ncbi:uncharacterized protein EKO05_0010807 [Ascochyta rabiei]|uniref:non-specific serine/threonine protein kinase n=1 Tax=Didymella rabiei TaxID=5454 RepID=A0A163F4T9_DIDRA|nr:uncharacterized protein EKO05_0010807 [Ascochyta rabiei]KZM24148.1 ATP binding [Ascochyta rabiei]UPX20579.1 hypothetical protein EKO05_0010807 [Ascochyta rabiei]
MAARTPVDPDDHDFSSYTADPVTATDDDGPLCRGLGINNFNCTSFDAISSDIDLQIFEYDAGNNSYSERVVDAQDLTDWGSLMETAFTADYLSESDLGLITRCITKLAFPHSWCSNPRLYCILHKMRRLDLFDKILNFGVTDLWLPLHKRMLRKWLTDDKDTRSFVRCQELCLAHDIPENLEGRHFSLTDVDELDLSRVKFLGAGGFGEVYHVKSQRNGHHYACKTMSRPVRYESHLDLMRNFKREIFGMRRVQHQHCVNLVASCTDMDSVTLLSSPVADMDLSALLNSTLDAHSNKVLRRAVGCITSALTYLHHLSIRHDDLKPNNILIHGANILLTDFGFCLDSSESGVTTTAGPPMHSTKRYSAPEVFSYAPRSRLTDIWSLGCVLFDIVSVLQGFSLDTMQAFWLSNGTKYDSYAENPEATAAWFNKVTRRHVALEDLWLISFIETTLLEPDRLSRPAAVQIFERLKDATPSSGQPAWTGACCSTSYKTSNHSVRLANDDAEALSQLHAGSPNRRSLTLDRYGAEPCRVVIFVDIGLHVPVFKQGWDLQDIKQILYEPQDFLHLVTTVRCLLIRNSFIWTRDSAEWSQVSYEELTKSMYISCPSRVDSETTRLRLRLGSEAPRSFTVEFILLKLQLERRPGHGLPFLAMTFDSVEPESTTYRQASDFATKNDYHRTEQPTINTEPKHGSSSQSQTLNIQLRTLPIDPIPVDKSNMVDPNHYMEWIQANHGAKAYRRRSALDHKASLRGNPT